MQDISKQENKWIAALAVLFSAIGFYFAYKTTDGTFLPQNDDGFRDMAIAENMLHGSFFSDPSYKGELLWYNPLLPALEACLSKISGLPLNIILSQAGKYLNLLIPFTLFVMCAKMFDKRIALASVAASIFFICGNDYGTHTSGYTYFLLAICFTQSVFYLVILFTWKTLQSKKNLHFFLLGIFTGILFLFHSAPSFLFCLILGFCFLHALIQKEMTLKEVLAKGILFSASFLTVSAPLLYNIFIHYGFQVKNVDPTQWVYYSFRPGNEMIFVNENVNTLFFVAIAGLIVLIKSKAIHKIAKRILLYWFSLSLLLFIYLYTIVELRTKYGINLPGFVPSVDIFFYVKAAETILAAIGFAAIISWLAKFLEKIPKLNFKIIFYAALLGVILLRIPSYATRKEFTLTKTRVKEWQKNTSHLSIYNWLRNNTNINDVILCEIDEAKYPAMPSGRKLTAAYIYYSNPYVSYADRKSGCDSMFQNLSDSNINNSLFEKYDVTYLLLKIDEQQMYPHARAAFPTVVYKDEQYVIMKRQ